LCTLIQPLRQKWHVQKKEHVVCYLDEPIFEMNVQLKDVTWHTADNDSVDELMVAR